MASLIETQSAGNASFATPKIAPAVVSPSAPYIANIAAEPPPRFTVDGDAALEQHLATTCERIAAGLRGLLPARRLEAVLLGGGYGRGEGGVCATPDGDRPYNDLEFYVFLRGNRHLNALRYGRALHVFGEILTPQAGVEVEFRIASLRELRRAGPSMFSYDLVCGHRRIVGGEAALRGCAHHGEAGRIPIAEATRLMMNRCTGLLLAQERLARPAFTPADADFVRRNIAKAQLGAGDAVLAALGRYHWSARERGRRVEALAGEGPVAWLPRLRQHHRVGVEFKLHPERCRAARQALARLHAEVSDLCREVWLWIEERRLHYRFASIRDYALGTGHKGHEAGAVRSAAINLKVFGGRALRLGAGLAQHPRERVLSALPLLLWGRDAMSEADVAAAVRRVLHADSGDRAHLLATYRRIWERVN